MVTIPKRNTSVLTFAGFAPAYPDIETWSENSGNTIFSVWGATSDAYASAGDSVYWVAAAFFNDEKYIATKFDLLEGGPDYNAVYFNENSREAHGFVAGKFLHTFNESNGSDNFFAYFLLDAPDNALTSANTLTDYTVIDTPVLKTSLAPSVYRNIISGFDATNFSFFSVNAYVTAPDNLIKVTVAAFDGDAMTVYNAFQFNRSGAYSIYYSPILLGDKYNGSTHTTLFSYASSLHSAQWEPETYIDGYYGTFGSTIVDYDFDDTVFNDITTALGWYPIDFGNDAPYGLITFNWYGDAPTDLYLITIARDFSWYDTYALSSSDLISDAIFDSWRALNYASFLYNPTTENIIIESGPGNVLQYASAFLSFAVAEPSRNKYRFRIPMECSDYCIPLMKKRKV